MAAYMRSAAFLMWENYRDNYVIMKTLPDRGLISMIKQSAFLGHTSTSVITHHGESASFSLPCTLFTLAIATTSWTASSCLPGVLKNTQYIEMLCLCLQLSAPCMIYSHWAFSTELLLYFYTHTTCEHLERTTVVIYFIMKAVLHLLWQQYWIILLLLDVVSWILTLILVTKKNDETWY